MPYRVFVEPLAKQDIRLAKQWLADQKEGLEEYFRDELDQAINRISSNPHAYAVVENEIRQAKLKNFPYVVSYLIYQDKVHVIAVLHGHRDPAEWNRRT